MDRFDLVVQLGTQRRPQMAVNVERRRDACVSKPGLDLLRVGIPFPELVMPSVL